MNAWDRRVIQYAGCAVAVETRDPRALSLLESVVYEPLAEQPVEAPRAVFQVEVSSGEAETYTLYQDGAPLLEAGRRAQVGELLMSCICRTLAQYSTGGVLFHAAALASGSAGIILPGGIGSGKTTFTVWALTLGLDYLSDELVYIPWDGDVVRAFARPLHLKPPSRPVLAGWINPPAGGREMLADAQGDLLPPEALNPRTRIPISFPALRLILLPRYRAGGETSFQPLKPGEAALELMQCLVNARSLPEYGFAEAARLARLAPAVKLVYSHFDQVEGDLRNLLDSLNQP